MQLEPAYGETVVPGDELQYLLPSVKTLLGEPVKKADVYDLEQEFQLAVSEDLMLAVVFGRDVLAPSGVYLLSPEYQLPAAGLGVDELIDDAFLRALHWALYSDVWTWAGATRRSDTNIGVPWEQISVELRNAVDNLRHRYRNTSDWTPRELGIAVHAETVRIHPFTDGNGRVTRLLGDLVFVAAQVEAGESDGPSRLAEYDWGFDKEPYVELLRSFAQHRDPSDLAEFVRVRDFGS